MKLKLQTWRSIVVLAITLAISATVTADAVADWNVTTNVGPTVHDTRTYHRFSDAEQDVVDARVYAGTPFALSMKLHAGRAGTWRIGPSKIIYSR